jgi:hypothetical protein
MEKVEDGPDLAVVVSAPLEENSTDKLQKEAPAPEEEVSLFVRMYVKYSVSLTLLHLILAACCAGFALPYFDLSEPDAGLRLREHPIADRGDGFYAAWRELSPEGFGAGGIVSGGSLQSRFVVSLPSNIQVV